MTATSVLCRWHRLFAHEIGHNLGAHHEPESFGDDFSARRQSSIRPYAFAYSVAGRRTIMAARADVTRVPWFSTVREQPNGQVAGIAGESENERALREVGIPMAVRYSDFLPDPSKPAAPGNLTVMPTGAATARLAWVDRSDNENGFRVQGRLKGERWQTAKTVPADTEAAEIDGLASGGRYDFRVQAFNGNGASSSNVVTVVLPAVEYTDCAPTAPQITFEHGYTVSMCIEYLEGGIGPVVQADAQDYGLDSRESGLLYFFDRDNAEVLIKVLDACAVNNHWWVFVAPVTTLAFNIHVDETATGKRWTHQNPKGDRTATTKSDLAAFPCDGPSSPAATADGGQPHPWSGSRRRRPWGGMGPLRRRRYLRQPRFRRQSQLTRRSTTATSRIANRNPY